MWVAVIKMLLEIAVLFMRQRSDAEMKQIGEDNAVRKALAELTVRSSIARDIAIDSESWDREHIDRILQRYYRNEGSDQ